MKIPMAILAAALAAVSPGARCGAGPVAGPFLLAQHSGAVPPQPGKADDPPVVVTYGVILLLAAGIIGANLIPSKRGHQD